MIKRFSFLVLVLVLAACKSPIEKLLMSNDVELKEQKAQEYFENCDYANASPLFKDLIQTYNSTTKIEKVYFYYAYCDYKLEDYLLAAYEFKKIISKFPRGKYTERAQFLIADCYYNSVPKFNLDQEHNLQAVQEFQIFIEKYPSSERIQEANDKISTLLKKREKKAFENAKLYFNTGDYRSAIHSFQQVLNDYPDSDRAEQMRALTVEAAYLYAEESIESKRAERYREVEKFVQDYLRFHSNNKGAKNENKVADFQEKSKKKALVLEYSLPHYYLKKRKYDEAIVAWKKLISKERDAAVKLEMKDWLLEANYQKAFNAENKDKLEAVKLFLDAYESLSKEFKGSVAEKWKSKNEYYSKQYKNLPIDLAYEFLSAGDYKKADEYFELVMDTLSSTNPEKDKHFYFSIAAKNKYAKKLKEVEAKVEWDKIIANAKLNTSWEAGKFKGKTAHLLEEVNEHLATYPLVLITKAIKRKEYGVAISRAEKLIDGQKAEKHQEEVVYLLLLSSLKKAKSVKKYERLPQYKFAKSNYNKYSSLVKDEKLSVKLKNIEASIDKGLTKYLNKD